MDVIDKGAVLIIEPPSHIIFRRSIYRPAISTLCLVNPSESKIIFKLKISAPKSYGVRPNFGVVHPQNFVEIEIVRVSDAKGIKTDRFLIQSLVVPAHIGDMMINEYWRTADPASLSSWKLRCVLLSPRDGARASMAVTPRSIEELRQNRLTGGDALLQKQIDLLQSELDDVINENENLRKEKIKLAQDIQRLVSISNILEQQEAIEKKTFKAKLYGVYYLLLLVTFAVSAILIGQAMF